MCDTYKGHFWHAGTQQRKIYAVGGCAGYARTMRAVSVETNSISFHVLYGAAASKPALYLVYGVPGGAHTVHV